MFLSIFLQVDTATTGTSVASQSVFDIILNSGPLGITIISIQVLLVFIALYIFIERYFTISAVVKEDQRVMQNLRSNIGSGNISTIQSICASSDTPLARMIEKDYSDWVDLCQRLKVLSKVLVVWRLLD